MATLAQLLTMAGQPGANQRGMTTNQVGPTSLGEGETDTTDYEGLLKLAQQYDPNARYDTGEAGGSGMTHLLQFDRSKLPEWTGPSLESFDKGNGKGGNFWDSYSDVNDGKGQGGATLKDPSKVMSAGDYGNFTHRSNLNVAEGDKQTGVMGALEKYMPSVISAVMAAGAGAGAGPLLGGLLNPKTLIDMASSGGEGAGSLLGNLAAKYGLSLIPGADAIAPYVSIANGIYGASRGNIGSGAGAALTLGKLLNNGG